MSREKVRDLYVAVAILQLFIIAINYLHPLLLDDSGNFLFVESKYVKWFFKDSVRVLKLLSKEALYIGVAFYFFRRYILIPISFTIYELWQIFVHSADYGGIDIIDPISNFITRFLYGALWILILHCLYDIYKEKRQIY